MFRKSRLSGQELIKYRYSVGGGMNGGSYSFEIGKVDEEHAKITVSEAEWHNEEPEEKEYIVDRKVLDEIKEAALRAGMYRWEGKQISNIQVMDGESYRYSFIFTDDDFAFSSQIYPAKYSKKLDLIDEVIAKYYTKEE